MLSVKIPEDLAARPDSRPAHVNITLVATHLIDVPSRDAACVWCFSFHHHPIVIHGRHDRKSPSNGCVRECADTAGQRELLNSASLGFG